MKKQVQQLYAKYLEMTEGDKGRCRQSRPG